jgi:hypothetical protein
MENVLIISSSGLLNKKTKIVALADSKKSAPYQTYGKTNSGSTGGTE